MQDKEVHYTSSRMPGVYLFFDPLSQDRSQEGVVRHAPECLTEGTVYYTVLPRKAGGKWQCPAPARKEIPE